MPGSSEPSTTCATSADLSAALLAGQGGPRMRRSDGEAVNRDFARRHPAGTAVVAGCVAAVLGGVIVLFAALGVLYVVNGGLPEQTAVGAVLAAFVAGPILFVTVSAATHRRLRTAEPLRAANQPRRRPYL